MADASIVATGISGGFQITEAGLATIDPSAPNGRLVSAEMPLSPFAQEQQHETLPPNPLQRSLEFAQRHAQPHPKPARQAFSLTPGAVLKLARHRVRELSAEIRRLKALEKERDQLKRLIAAASKKPQAPVRPLRSSQTG